ncbi:MAG TPA: RluA family pseudouridine synthase [Pirellulaceae bacterium]|nr:RluA family pseudouridine synthase [Pirellulaceae bacterium]
MAPSDTKLIHILPEQDQIPLGTALKRNLDGQPWSHVRKLLETRHIQVNGNLCIDENRRLNAGDVIKICPQPQAPPPKQSDIKIRYYDKHVIVVEKPSGMTTLRHNEEQDWSRHRKDIAPTLDEVLPRVLGKLERNQAAAPPKKDRRFPHGRRGSLPQVKAVHRLDRDTSGLMIFARSIQAERHLVQQFKQHTTHRSYLAVVHGGDLKAQTIETNLVRDRGDGRRGSKANAADGQRALTHVKPIERLGDFTLVECRLETGRTHQIRIHLSELGHYVCGDKVYCQPLFQPAKIDRSGAPRLALHAQELGFVHPITGAKMHYTMPLPPDLAQWVNRLRQQANPKR